MRVLLASASPRRKNLLETLGVAVTVRPASIDETERPGESAPEYLARVVDAKLEAALAMTDATLEGHDALMVADTTVDLDGALLHKPEDDEDTRRMLRALSGRSHVVRTRFGLASANGERHVESVITDVFFRALEHDEIEAYVKSGEGNDKAGAYGIQGAAAAFITRIEGSYGAVVGLPSSEVIVALRKLCR